MGFLSSKETLKRPQRRWRLLKKERWRTGATFSFLTWIFADDAVAILPFGSFVIQRLIEDEKHSQEVEGQQSVIYQIEKANFDWKEKKGRRMMMMVRHVDSNKRKSFGIMFQRHGTNHVPHR